VPFPRRPPGAFSRTGGQLRRSQEQRFRAYKASEFSDGQVHDLIIQVLDTPVVPVTRMPNVIREWREPRYPDFRKCMIAWRLFNGYVA
jgi:hypothetical protein